MRQERSSTVLFVAGTVLGLVAFVPAGALSLRSIVVSAGIASILILIIRRTGRVFVFRAALGTRCSSSCRSFLRCCCWDISMPSTVQHDFLIGPANEVRHGRYVLVDAYSQYGVVAIYFVAAALQLLSFEYGSSR